MSGHLPVMLKEVLTIFDAQPGLYIDCTFGRGGYTQGLLEAHPENKVIAIDRDAEAIAWGQNQLGPVYGPRICFVHSRFSALKEIAHSQGLPLAQGIVFDLGVSSPQLDQGERGFSFMAEGPLDMGMGLHGVNAADFLNTFPEEEIATVLKNLGEERHARRLAQKIVHYRKDKPFETTQELVRVIKEVVPKDPSGIHPATRTFQGLRLWVNQELTELTQVLDDCAALLVPEGKLVVLSFHSLEDRIVKQFFRKNSRPEVLPNRHASPLFSDGGLGELPFQVPGKQPLRPLREESSKNPRARSARLRYGILRPSEGSPP